MKYALVFSLLFAPFFLFSQKYRYRFHGDLTTEAETSLAKKIEDLQFFTDVKFRVKPEAQIGDLFFTIPHQASPSESQPAYSPVTIKRFLIESGLEPEGFTEIDD